MKVVKNPTKTRKKAAAKPRRERWRTAVRRLLAEVPEIDAVYATPFGTYVHVYSFVQDSTDKMYKKLLMEEALIEKAFPKTFFEFHTRFHRGEKPTGEERGTAELLFLR